VFVHGLSTSSAIWDHQVAAMTLEGHDSIAIDLPGHGARFDEQFTLRGALDAIDQAVESCSVPPLLVGLSLGGYSSLAYAARNHGKIAGVMLSGCSTEIRGKPVDAYRSLYLKVAQAFRPTSSTWRVVADMLAAVSGHSSLADLKHLLIPVWLVNGQRDILRMDERRYLAVLPGAQLTVVPNAGHDVNSHAPIAFNRILLGALHELGVANAALAPATHS
jgi:pimeloyl-ACP methyl ester carboxylesterase